MQGGGADAEAAERDDDLWPAAPPNTQRVGWAPSQAGPPPRHSCFNTPPCASSACLLTGTKCKQQDARGARLGPRPYRTTRRTSPLCCCCSRERHVHACRCLALGTGRVCVCECGERHLAPRNVRLWVPPLWVAAHLKHLARFQDKANAALPPPARHAQRGRRCSDWQRQPDSTQLSCVHTCAHACAHVCGCAASGIEAGHRCSVRARRALPEQATQLQEVLRCASCHAPLCL